jgi:hypothetical protein
MSFGNQNPPLTIPNEEDAFHFIVRALRDTTENLENYGYKVYLPKVFDVYLKKVCGFQDRDNQGVYRQIAPAFYAAAWELCRRGVLRPGVMNFHGQETEYVNGYTVTPAGMKWLKDAGQYDYVPIEPGRFSKLLDSFSPRFGAGFQERSQEAIRCYGTNAYLGCCAMCGAAAESILLAVAISKDGDKDKIEKLYLASGGRGRIEKLILGSQSDNIQNECRGYLSLLKYWRDLTAHGRASGITDGEAYTSLAFLLRFAQFVNDRWNEMTKR